MGENLFLFDVEGYKVWRKEWQNMPEFSQEDLRPKYQLIVSFISYEDVQEFSKLINQKMTPETKSIWFPEVGIEVVADKRYVDES